MHHCQPGFYSYLVQRDLNGAGGPVTSGLNPRALFYFFGLTTRQQVENLSTSRLLVSYEPAYETGLGAPREPRAHQVVEPGGKIELRAGAFHVLVWIDPATSPTGGAPVLVRVGAL